MLNRTRHSPSVVLSPMLLLLAIVLLWAFVRVVQTLADSEATSQGISIKPEEGNIPLLVVRTRDREVPLGDSCRFYAELHNAGTTHLVIYMPGLSGYPVLNSPRKDLRVDGYGPPVSYGRIAHHKAQADFVVLEPGDYYGRSYEWDPPDLGKVTFACTYKNKESGKDIGFSAWIGEIKAVESAEANITGGPKSLALLEKQMDQTGLARVVAIRKLGYLGEDGAIPVLLRALDDKTVIDGQRRYQEAAAYALQRLAGKDLGLPTGLNEFDSERHVARVREWAQKYLKGKSTL